MAIEKMRLLSVVGKEEKINSFILKYLIGSGLQPENAINVFEKGWNLSYFVHDNTARDLKNECNELEKYLNISVIETKERKLTHTLEDLRIKFNNLKESSLDNDKQIKESKAKYEELNLQMQMLKYLINLDINLEDIYNLRYMRFRYGKISKENYEKIEAEIDDIDAIIIELGYDDEYIWLMYLTTDYYSKSADSFFNIAKFERTWIPREIIGTPINALEYLSKEKNKIASQIKILEQKREMIINKLLGQLSNIKAEIDLYLKINTVKRYMAHDKKGNFYVVGWLPLDNLEKMIPTLEKEKDLEYVVKKNDEVASIAPTHLKNNKLFKPFEALVEMYGLPNYSELDPTIFVAITSFLMFGLMFGDVGHGLIFLIIRLNIKN